MLTGYWPNDVFLYRLSLRHHSANEKSASAASSCNERLEYLGDAVLSQIVAEHLFKRYPLKDEGFLTEMRSKIVNRTMMNQLAILIGLDRLVVHQLDKRKQLERNLTIYGNALEAFIGALYLDRGIKATNYFIVNRLITFHLSLKELENVSINPKNKLAEFASKNKLGKVTYQIHENKHDKRHRFGVTVLLDGEPIATGHHLRKKEAEQLASEIAFSTLQHNFTANHDGNPVETVNRSEPPDPSTNAVIEQAIET